MSTNGRWKILVVIRSNACLLSLGLVAVALTLLAGCSPPPPTSSQAHLSVGMPDGEGSELSDDPIEPPYLSDLKETPAETVAVRVGEESRDGAGA